MKTLFWILFVLGTATGLVWMARHDGGYILINQFGYSIEISVVLAIAFLLVSFLILYWLFRWLGMLMRTPKTLAVRNERRAVEKAHVATSRGYAALIEGDFAKAEKQLMTNIDRNPTPMLNYLAAANSAQQREDYSARDEFIKQALETSPRDRLAIGLTKARLQYQAGQSEDSMLTLKRVQKFAPKNKRLLRLMTEVGRESGDWDTVMAVLPAAKRVKALPAAELDEIEAEANQQILALPAGGEAGAEVARRYDSLPSARRKDPRIVERYARSLLDGDSHDKAEQVLRGALKKQFDPELVYLYGLTQSSTPEQSLKTAEAWSKNHADDADLLLTLGRLSMQNKIWGKARSYLEASIAQGGRPEATRELGMLLEQLGETSAAMNIYKAGLSQVVSEDSSVADLLPDTPTVNAQGSGGELVDKS